MSAYSVVHEFEQEVATWSGARYGIAVESCSAALFLSCLFRKVGYCIIPFHTYPSVPCSIINAGGYVGFRKEAWSGVYELEPYDIWDGALRFMKGMYHGGLHCLSFHSKKQLPIGRGGMILTDSAEAADWLRVMRFDGRNETPLPEDHLKLVGHNFYMQPEQAARGLVLFEHVRDRNMPDLIVSEQGYPDLSQVEAYRSFGVINLRPVTMDDAKKLLGWKNEEDTRKNSIVSQELIKMEDHLKWLERTFADSSVEFYIIQIEGQDVGDLRLNHQANETEVSIRLDKKYRGMGLATRVISMLRGENLMAKIVAHNLASMRVFMSNGYSPQEYVLEPMPHYIFRKQ